MKEILIAVVSALMGALAMKFMLRFMKRLTDNNSNNDNMSRNDYGLQREFDESSSCILTQIDEKQPSPIAMIYKSELDYISRCILDYPDIETGGQLFGFWTTEGIPVVMYAIGPGPNSEHHVVHFIQDSNYLEQVGEVLINKYGLQHIGEWHSHHQLGLAKPSGQDSSNMFHLVQKFSFRHFLLCIGNCTATESTLNAFSFHINSPNEYVQARWDVKNMDSPFRTIVDSEMGGQLVHPLRQDASIGNLLIWGERNATVIPNYGAEYWLNIKENNKILKDIIDYLKQQENYNVSVQMDENKIVHLFLNKEEIRKHVSFPEGFPYTAPTIETIVDNENSIITPNIDILSWNYSGDIYNTFINYFKCF